MTRRSADQDEYQLAGLPWTAKEGPMPDKGPGSKGGAKKPKGGKAAAAGGKKK